MGARLGTYITGWLKQIGIATTSEVVGDGKLVSAWLDNDYDLYVWGWGPDPDPDFILSTFTSSQCGTWSDTCYSNPQYDKLYKEQQIAPNPQARQAIVFQMQQLLYKDNPELVLYYDKSLEAYNSTKWTGLEDNTSPAAGRVPVEPIHAVLGAHGAAQGGGHRLERVVELIPAGDCGYPRSHHRGGRDRHDRSTGQVRRGSRLEGARET